MWIHTGRTLADRRRGLAVHQGERNDAHASAHIFLRRRKRAIGRADEVPVGFPSSLPSVFSNLAWSAD